MATTKLDHSALFERDRPTWIEPLLDAVRQLRFGSVEITVHDGRIVQSSARKNCASKHPHRRKRFFAYRGTTFSNGEWFRLSPQGYYGPFGLLWELRHRRLVARDIDGVTRTAAEEAGPGPWA